MPLAIHSQKSGETAYSMKVGIITFHASHNYGSMLQAYALQQVVTALGHDCEIINFRTERQRQYYKPFWAEYPRLKKISFFIRHPRLSYNAYRKHCLFERFIKDNFRLSSEEYSNYNELQQKAQGYDAYISGSDQIWNVSCFDWDEAFSLGFVKNGRKVAYAPSMGPLPEKEVSAQTERLSRLIMAIGQYDAVSVREKSTADTLTKFTGSPTPEVVLDPTLLLDASKWTALIDGAPLIDEDYILLYSPWENPELYRRALEIAQYFKMKIVVTMSYQYTAYHANPNVRFHVAVGPKEFINLVSNTRLVVGMSFHAVAFAVIFGKQMYAYNGMEDNRVSSLLSLAGLEHFANAPKSLYQEADLRELYGKVRQRMAPIIDKSVTFLKKNLK